MDAKMKVERAAAGAAIDGVLKYVNHGDDRTKALLNLTDFVQKFTGNMFAEKTFDNIRTMLQNPDNKWVQYVNRGLDELDPQVIKMTALNLGFQAAFVGTKQIRMNREKYNCNIPWTMLMDPTSACNLHCTGCWAAEYGHKLNLSYEKLSDIISQGKELGTYFYMFTGGEPLVRKKDILRLAEEHHDCEFHCFTNGTLIDEEFCEAVQKLGNISFSLSLEGFEEVNDGRRGEGIFDKVLAAMDLMKKHGLLFGTSICYTRANLETVTSDEFLDLLIEHGCRYSWYFHFMPVGMDAAPELMPTVEQRKYIYHRLREIRSDKSDKQIFVMDFQNDGEFVGGLHCRRPQLLPHQLGRRRRALRVHPLFQRQHPRPEHPGDPAQPAVHGLPQRPAFQQESPASLPDAGEPRAAAEDGARDRCPQHRPAVAGERGASVREVQELRCQLAAHGRRDLVPYQDPREPLREL